MLPCLVEADEVLETNKSAKAAVKIKQPHATYGRTGRMIGTRQAGSTGSYVSMCSRCTLTRLALMAQGKWTEMLQADTLQPIEAPFIFASGRPLASQMAHLRARARQYSWTMCDFFAGVQAKHGCEVKRSQKPCVGERRQSENGE